MAQRDDDNRSGEDFGAILAAFEAEQADRGEKPGGSGPGAGGTGPKVGETVRGTVLAVTEDTIFVDLGAKAEGMLDALEMADDDGLVTIEPGDEVEAMVASVDRESGAFRLRTKLAGRGGDGAATAALMDELRQAQEAGLPVEGTVGAVVKGGVEVQVAGLRAFCPISQLDLRFVEDANEYLGRRLEFRILRLEEGRGGRPNVVLSRRALLEEEARRRAEELRSRLEEGVVVEGTVTSVTGYGAFLDLGGIEGLLHVSEMGHGRVEDPSQLVSVGQVLEVEILEMKRGDDGKDRISLSTKTLQRDPWLDVPDKMPVGTKVRGRVVRLQPFGAFVSLAPGVDGLVHISEMSDERIGHPREVVEVGDVVEVVVLQIDPERRRVGLTLARSAEEVEARQGGRPEASPGEKGSAVAAPAEGTLGSGLGSLGKALGNALRGESTPEGATPEDSEGST